MEYDVPYTLQLRSPDRASGEGGEVSGYIIIGGARPLTALGSSTSLVSVRAPALYSAPQIGAIHLAVNPEG